MNTRRRLLAGAITGAGVTLAGKAFAQAANSKAQVNFSTLAGGNDDDKLTNFMNAYRAATYKPTLVLDEARYYQFQKQQTIFNGFAMVGGGSRAVDQARSQNVVPQVIKLRLPGTLQGWLKLPGVTWGIYLAGLSFDVSPTCRLFDADTIYNIETSTFRDISCQNAASLFGKSGAQQLFTACVFDGFWNVSNVADMAFNLGGSDCRFTPQMLLLDSAVNNTALIGPTKYLMQLTAQSKTTLSNMYITAEQHSAIKITGGNNMVRLHHCEIEGRNAGQPCYGALIVSDGKYVQLSDSWVSYGMSNPGAAGHSPQDGGLIMVTGGTFEVLNCHTQQATNVSSPFIYATGSGTKVIVRNIVGEGYTGKPVVKTTAGAVADVDGSVSLTSG